jgi:transcriptional regulator with XRE-family HTH domain
MATAHPRRKGASFAAEFGARLRAIREKRGETQSSLADGIRTYASQISKYETGEVVPGGETLAALAEVLSVSLDELVLGRTNGQPEEVHDGRLRLSVRALEELGNRRLTEVAVTVINALVAAEPPNDDAASTSKRRTG